MIKDFGVYYFVRQDGDELIVVDSLTIAKGDEISNREWLDDESVPGSRSIWYKDVSGDLWERWTNVTEQWIVTVPSNEIRMLALTGAIP